MIVPMKKISIMVLDKERDAALERIRELGVLHVDKKMASSVAVNHLFSRKSKIEMAITILENTGGKKKRKRNAKSAGGESSKDYSYNLVDRVVLLDEKRRTLHDWIHTNNRELRLYDNWGDFNPSEFKSLNDAGIVLTPYIISQEVYSKLPQNQNCEYIVLKTDKKAVSLVTVNSELPGITPAVMPEHNADKLRKMNDIKIPQIEQIETELARLAGEEKRVHAEHKEIMQKIEFEINKAGMDKVSFNKEGETNSSGFDFSVAYITGYVPLPDMGKVSRAAAENKWAFIADDPALDDQNVPTKLENNKFASLIYPLTGFLDMMPGYREVDISGWFMLFFTVFFGMIFGDAAYGLVLFLVAIIGILATARKGVPAGLKMLLIFSLSNITWGVLTCSWFSIPHSQLPQILRDMSLDLISTANGADETEVKNHLIEFCFGLALIQLCVAHIKGVFRYITSLKVLGQIASLLMIIGMWDVVFWLVIGNEYEVFHRINTLWSINDGVMIALYLLIAGFALNFIFGSYERVSKNIFKNVGISILTSLKNIISVVLGVTNVFSDIMSYIRLWAVGLAGASIANTVNGMAAGMFGNTAGPIFAQLLIFAGIVLVCFGHSFNMVLNVLSVLVHGVRLNTLEFSGHLGLTWCGFAYKPFKLTVSK